MSWQILISSSSNLSNFPYWNFTTICHFNSLLYKVVYNPTQVRVQWSMDHVNACFTVKNSLKSFNSQLRIISVLDTHTPAGEFTQICKRYELYIIKECTLSGHLHIYTSLLTFNGMYVCIYHKCNNFQKICNTP